MKTSQAFDRVYKKLSAVRETLPNDEREIFDEVVAHKMNLGKASAKSSTKNTGKAEVKAHKLNMGKTSGKSSAKNTGKAEVKAHKLNISIKPAKKHR